MRPEREDEAREEYDCESCGTWWWSEPETVECEWCRETLCPRCQPVNCECGGTFCQHCALLVEWEGEEIYLCPDCQTDFGECDRCGQSPPELIFPREGGEALFLCPVCSLAFMEEAG